MVFYAQSTGTVISGRKTERDIDKETERQREKEAGRQADRQTDI